MLAELKKYSSVGAPSEKPSNTTTSSDTEVNNPGLKLTSGDFDENNDESEMFVPKWLTSKSMFQLELSDTVFRRTIYSQIYILCDLLCGNEDSLSNEDSSVKQAVAFPNRSVLYPPITDSEFIKYISGVQESIGRVTSLNAIDLDAAFLRSLKVVIGRDQNWQNWKKLNTPAFEIPALQHSAINAVDDMLQKQRGLKRPYQFLMGTPALSRLNREPTGLNILKNTKRTEIPDPHHYFEKMKKLRGIEEETFQMSEAESKPVLDNDAISSNEWRGFRIARMHGMWANFDKVTKTTFTGLFNDK